MWLWNTDALSNAITKLITFKTSVTNDLSLWCLYEGSSRYDPYILINLGDHWSEPVLLFYVYLKFKMLIRLIILIITISMASLLFIDKNSRFHKTRQWCHCSNYKREFRTKLENWQSQREQRVFLSWSSICVWSMKSLGWFFSYQVTRKCRQNRCISITIQEEWSLWCYMILIKHSTHNGDKGFLKYTNYDWMY